VTEYDLALFLLRVTLGSIMVMHGLNHWRGPGGVEGTARWFGSIGLKPPLVHAWMSVVLEIAAGVALIVGLLTPLAAASTIGSMTVAGVAAHRKNGFFVFKDGYEYVLLVAVACVSVSTLGAGGWSLDDTFGIVDDLDGWTGFTISLLGVAGAAGLLATCWRPEVKAAAE
jgi:putative oxidoreductase